MPKTRAAAPEEFRPTVYVSERAKLEAEYDAKYPDHKHIWKREATSAEDMAKIGAEPVIEKSGGKITNGIQMLCRVARKGWDARLVAQGAQSLQRVKTIHRNYDGSLITDRPLTVTRNPRRPPGTE